MTGSRLSATRGGLILRKFAHLWLSSLVRLTASFLSRKAVTWLAGFHMRTSERYLEGHLLIVARLGEILDALETAASGGTKPGLVPLPPD
jgi:hypothetical protein